MKLINPQILELLNDKPKSYIDGFEAGKIYFFLKSGKDINNMHVLKANKDMIELLCKNFGYTFKLNETKSTYVASLTAFSNKVCAN
jgi:hypothetical protein